MTKTCLTYLIALSLFFCSAFTTAHGEPTGPILPAVPTTQSIMDDSPQQLGNQKGKWSSFFGSQPTGVASTVATLGTTASAFYIVSSLQVLARMATEPERNVEMLRNFFTNQVFSAQAHLSILLSVAGIQAANSKFTSLGNKFSWIKDEQKVQNMMNQLARQKGLSGSSSILVDSKGFHPKLVEDWKKVNREATRLIPGKVTSEQFKKIGLLSSFALVMPIAMIFSDLMTDPDLIYYSESLISSAETIAKMTEEKGYSPYQAQQRAYDRWVTNNQIYEHVPTILAAWTALPLQLFAVPRIASLSAKAYETIVRNSPKSVSNVLIGGLQLTRSAGKLVPQLKIVRIAGETILFISMTDFIRRIYKDGMNGYLYRTRVLESQEQMMGAMVRPDVPAACLKRIMSGKNFDRKKWDETSYIAIKKILDLDDIDECHDLPESMEDLVLSTSAQYSRWRQLWIEEKLGPLISWASYMSDLDQNYSASALFYQSYIQAHQQKDPRLFKNSSFYGLGGLADIVNRNEKIADFYLLVKKNLGLLTQKKKSGSLSSQEERVLDIYSKMMTYLSSLDGSLPTPALLAEQIKKSSVADPKLKDLYIEEYASTAIILFNRADASEKFSDIYDIGSLRQMLSEASPKQYGEAWFESARLNEFININRSTKKVEDYKSVYANNFVEWYYLNGVCQDSDTSYSPVKKNPYWSLELKLPSLVQLSKQNPCSLTEISRNKEVHPQKTIFNSGFELEGQRYLNLVEYGNKKIKPEFLAKEFNFDTWWAAKVDEPLKVILESESRKVKNIYTTEIVPALFESRITKGLESSIVPSIKSEIALYLNLLNKHIPASHSVNSSVNQTFNTLEKIVRNPLAYNTWIADVKKVDHPKIKEFNERLLDGKSSSQVIRASQILGRYLAESIGLDVIKLADTQGMNSDQKQLVNIVSKVMVRKSVEMTELIQFQNVFTVSGMK